MLLKSLFFNSKKRISFKMNVGSLFENIDIIVISLTFDTEFKRKIRFLLC